MGQRDVDAQRDGGCPQEQVVGREGARTGIAMWAVGQRTGCGYPNVVCAVSLCDRCLGLSEIVVRCQVLLLKGDLHHFQLLLWSLQE